MLQNIFGPRREEATERLNRKHKDELYDSNYSPVIIRMIKSRRIKWAGHAACIGEKRNAYRVLARKTDGKRQHARPRPRLEDTIKINPKN